MAKRVKSYTSWWMLLAVGLLSAGWLMKPLPVLMLGALAPLLAISEQARWGVFWEKLEYILVAFLFSFWAARLFELPFVMPAIGQAIACTLVFGAAALARFALGPVASAFLFFCAWLGLEFAMLRAGLATHVLFLADAFSNRPHWTAWNAQLGYLATSAWILLANLVLYKACWSERSPRIGWLIAFLVVAAGPIGYSLAQPGAALVRSDMVGLYQGVTVNQAPAYAKHGEWVARTCAAVAALVILFTLVKLKISKR